MIYTSTYKSHHCKTNIVSPISNRAEHRRYKYCTLISDLKDLFIGYNEYLNSKLRIIGRNKPRRFNYPNYNTDLRWCTGVIYFYCLSTPTTAETANNFIYSFIQIFYDDFDLTICGYFQGFYFCRKPAKRFLRVFEFTLPQSTLPS